MSSEIGLQFQGHLKGVVPQWVGSMLYEQKSFGEPVNQVVFIDLYCKTKSPSFTEMFPVADRMEVLKIGGKQRVGRACLFCTYPLAH